MGLTASALTLVIACFGAAGCRSSDPHLPGVCSEGTAGIERALAAAPGAVMLAGGVKLSDCVARARSDGELQTLGFVYTRVADALAQRMATSDAAAVQLGYLVGATRRGGARTNGIHAELVRRMDQSIGIDGAPRHRRSAFARGVAAGRSGG